MALLGPRRRVRHRRSHAPAWAGVRAVSFGRRRGELDAGPRASDFACASPATGYAAEAHALYKTTYGGATWARIYQPLVRTGHLLTMLECPTPDDVWYFVRVGETVIQQEGYLLLHSSDGGIHFRPLVTGHSSRSRTSPSGPPKGSPRRSVSSRRSPVSRPPSSASALLGTPPSPRTADGRSNRARSPCKFAGGQAVLRRAGSL